MNKSRRRVVVLQLCFLLALIPALHMGSAVSADQNYGEIDYWYSDSDHVCKWSVTPKYYNFFNDYYFAPAMGAALSSWGNSGTGVHLTANGASASDYNIGVYWGTKDELNALGIFTICDNTAGMTIPAVGTQIGYYTYTVDNTTKNVYAYSSTQQASICVVNKSTNFSRNQHCAMHEMGHALGWKGHAPNVSDIMYSTYNSSSGTVLSNTDKQQIMLSYSH